MLTDRLRLRAPVRVRPFVRPRLFGVRARSSPISQAYGWDRGTPIDRVYIERFLSEHKTDIRGRVLEIKDATYTRRLGTDTAQVDILDIDPGNPNATIIADLTDARPVPDGSFDCLVVTQTLQYIAQLDRVVETLHRILAPGGVVLVTVPCVGKVTTATYIADLWRFTPTSIRTLFARRFELDRITVRAYGNSVSAAGFLLGYAAEELRQPELDDVDQDYPVIVGLRAQAADTSGP